MPEPQRKRNPKPRSKAERKPKATKKKRAPEADPNDLDFRELVVFLEQAIGFRLGLAYVDSFETRQTILGRLETLMADRPVALSTFDLGKFPGEELLLTRLKEHLRDHPAPEGKQPAIMVVGLESLLDYRQIHPHRPAPQPILRNANFQRDAFPRLVPAAVVMWLLPTASTLFAQEAPDLWHWRSGTFLFSGPPGARRDMERAEIARPLLESENLDASRQIERIALLRDLLVDLENDPDHDTPGSQARRASLLRELGLAHLNVSRNEQAKSFFEDALTLYRSIGDRRGEDAALGNLGLAYARLGQLEKAIGYHEQDLAIAREVGDRRGEGQTLGNLGNAYAALGQAEQAIGYHEQDLAIAREVGDRRGEGQALSNLGTAYADLGQAEKAIGFYEQHLAIAREVGDRRGEGQTLGNLGTAYADLGQLEKAIGYYEKDLAIAREVGDRRGESAALGNLGIAYRNLGQLEKAIGYYEQTLAIAREVGDRRGEGQTLGNLGLAYAALGQAEKAGGLLQDALQIGREIKDPRISSWCEQNLAALQPRSGDTSGSLGREPQGS